MRWLNLPSSKVGKITAMVVMANEIPTLVTAVTDTENMISHLRMSSKLIISRTTKTHLWARGQNVLVAKYGKFETNIAKHKRVSCTAENTNDHTQSRFQ